MVKSYLIDGKNISSNSQYRGQHWERFHVLGRVDYIIVQGLWLYLAFRPKKVTRILLYFIKSDLEINEKYKYKIQIPPWYKYRITNL